MNYQSIDSFNDWKNEEQDLFTINIIKGLVMDGVRKANSGHPGGPMSLADFSYILYSEFLVFDSKNPDWQLRDRLVLSVGHTCMLLYTLLYLSDILNMEDLKSFRQINSRTPGHPEIETPGVDSNAGPLGQGVGMGIGMALAEKMLQDSIKNDRSQYTYILAGDGDVQEPIALGAASLAGHWQLSQLIMFYDKNDIQIAGETNRCDSTNYAQLFESMNWDVQEINGHNHGEIRDAITNAQQTSKPSIIIGNTTMAKGSHSMENKSEAHGAPFTPEEIVMTKKKLGLPENEEFYCPDVLKKHFQRNFSKKIEATNSSSKYNFDFNIDDALRKISDIEFNDEIIATRKAFGMTLDELAKHIPMIVGGSADLDGSNCTTNFANEYGDFSASNPKGRNIAFGVREFPMAAILNGISLYGGLIPFGGTFLVFSDYMRSAIRLSAIQKLHVIYEFTHDSIFVGEDGPTHQPVEHIMSLRSIPDLMVFRPADAVETQFCFETILENDTNPSTILLTRQKLPLTKLDKNIIKDGVKKGAYIVVNHDNPDAIVFTTGSELSLTLSAVESLNQNIKVVNMPCWEIFDQQSDHYKDEILTHNCKKRISIEAGTVLGWEKFVGKDGLKIGINEFGFSAPGKDVAEKLNFTKEVITKKIEDYLK
ncbi:MAG: transketolase family protein [Candidatus Neomarinimicrobiota bacterium]